MAGSLGVITGVILAKSDVTLLARILGLNGQPITAASISAITWNVQDLTTAASIITGSFTPVTTIFDSLQQNDPMRWDHDSADDPGPDGLWGYNFLGSIPGTAFAANSVDPITNLPLPHTYQVDVEFEPVNSRPFRQSWQLVATPTWP